MKKLLFDLDDTLIDHTRAERLGAAKFGRRFAGEIPGYERETFGQLWQKASQRHIRDFLAQNITFAEQRIRRIRDIFQNPDITDENALEYFSHYLKFYEDSWRVFPDVEETLFLLKERRIEMGVLSDGSQKQQELKLVNKGIRSYFSFVITAESEGMAKPDRDFFLRGAERLHTNPENVVYVGDNCEKDAVGATEAGLIGVWLDRNQSSSPYVRTINSLREITETFLD